MPPRRTKSKGRGIPYADTPPYHDRGPPPRSQGRKALLDRIARLEALLTNSSPIPRFSLGEETQEQEAPKAADANRAATDANEGSSTEQGTKSAGLGAGAEPSPPNKRKAEGAPEPATEPVGAPPTPNPVDAGPSNIEPTLPKSADNWEAYSIIGELLHAAPRQTSVSTELHRARVTKMLDECRWANSPKHFVDMLGGGFIPQQQRSAIIAKMTLRKAEFPLPEEMRFSFLYDVLAETISAWTTETVKGKRPAPKAGELCYHVPPPETPAAPLVDATLSAHDRQAMTPADATQQEAMFSRAMQESLRGVPAGRQATGSAARPAANAARPAVATGPAAPTAAGAPVQAPRAAVTTAQPVSAGPAGAATAAGAPVEGAATQPTQVSDPRTAHFEEMLHFDSAQSKAVRVTLPNPSLFDGDITKLVPSVYATMEDYVVHLTRHALRAEVSMAELIHLYFKGEANVWARQWTERRLQEGLQPYVATSTKTLAPFLLKDLDADFGKQLRPRDRKALEALLQGTYGQGANEPVALYTSRFRMLMQEGGPFTDISQVSYYQQGLKAELRRHCTVDHFGKEFKSLAPLIDYASGMERKFGTHKLAASNSNAQSVSFAQAQQKPHRPRGGRRSRGGKANQWNYQQGGYQQQAPGHPGLNQMAKLFSDFAKSLGAPASTSYGGYQPQGRGGGRGRGQFQRGGRGGPRGGRGGGGRGRGRGRSHTAFVVEEVENPQPPPVPHPLTLTYDAGAEAAHDE